MKFQNKISQLSILTLSSIALLSCDLAKADEYEKGFYSTISVGMGKFSEIVQGAGQPNIETDPGFSFEGSIGYDFGKTFRTDLSYTNTTSSVVLAAGSPDGKFEAIMLNAYLDFPIENTRWEPFLGIGAGTANADLENLCTAAVNTDCTDNVFAYGLSGGVNYYLDSITAISAKISYIGFGDITITDQGAATTIQDSETLSAHVGIKFKF